MRVVIEPSTVFGMPQLWYVIPAVSNANCQRSCLVPFADICTDHSTPAMYNLYGDILKGRASKEGPQIACLDKCSFRQSERNTTPLSMRPVCNARSAGIDYA